jgi:hypothetical protein
MKSLCFALSVALMAFSTVVFAQPDGATAQPSDAQKAFDRLKTLAGSWDAVLSGTGSEADGQTMHVTLRVTSTGNAVLHEMTGLAGRPDDPITMFYLDGDRLLLTHYCDAGNRPRMVGTMSPDGKTLEFEFLDISGSPLYHMHHSVFTIIDANHHTEDWTFMMKDKPVRAHFDLYRTN